MLWSKVHLVRAPVGSDRHWRVLVHPSYYEEIPWKIKRWEREDIGENNSSETEGKVVSGTIFSVISHDKNYRGEVSLIKF